MTSRQYKVSDDRKILGNKPYFSHSVRPSRSSSRSDTTETDRLNVESHTQYAYQPGAREKDEHSQRPHSKDWIPYTLRHHFMGLLGIVTLALCLITFLLWWRSSTNYGLGPDDGSSALLFGWRYTPTLITVIYVQLTTMLFDDVKRTEPFARLARPEGAESSSTILYSSGPWWVTLYDGLAKRKNGRRSWVLVCAALANIFGFLAISSLSSAYLYSVDMIVPQSTDFYRLVPSTNSPLPINADSTTHFRTIANLLQNVSTSPWITDNYTILPFWPTTLHDNPINTLPTDSNQKWQAETTMFKSELSCTQMTVEAERTGKFSIPKGYAPSDGVSIIWSSPDGCKYGLMAPIGLWNMGGSSWSRASTFFYGEDILYTGTIESIVNSTAECKDREIIIATEPWTNTSGSYTAQLCDTAYYMANVSVSVQLDGNEPEISFDDSEFEEKKVAIPDTLVNTTEFQDLALNRDWATYMISIIWSNTAMMGGASVLLGALYDYNMTKLVHDPHLVASAGKAKQRYFGEVLQAALSQWGASKKAPMQGTVHAVQTRVVVEPGTAIAMGVLFAVSFILLMFVWWRSRLQARPLNLGKDPATAAGMACLLTQDSRTRSGFESLRQPTTNDLEKKLAGQRYYTDSQGLSRISDEDITSHDSSQSENGTPRLLRLPALLGLVVCLAVAVVGVAVLYHYAESSDLYGKAFVYQFKLSFLAQSMSSMSMVAPVSMIPTVIAVGLGLWWSAIDENFRRLQPYLSMAKSNPSFNRGVDLSYQTSYWFWAAGKAAFNKHWLLFLVTLGSTLSPVCKLIQRHVLETSSQTHSHLSSHYFHVCSL